MSVSSRLSLDIKDLPLTPFGMKSHTRTNNKRNPTCGKNNKLSLKCNKNSPAEECKSAPGHSEHTTAKEQTSPMTCAGVKKIFSDKTNVRPPQQTSVLTDILEDDFLDEFPSGNKKCSDEKPSSPRSKRRQSVFSTIDSGSFVEFCQRVQTVHLSDQKKSKRKLLYYTCQSQNETNFSTSTKVPSAPVGFRRFVEAIKRSSPKDPSGKSSPCNTPTYFDETIIAGSADIFPNLKSRRNVALSSTMIKSGRGANSVPPLHGNDKQSISAVTPNVQKSLVIDTIILSDSSDDEVNELIRKKSVHTAIRSPLKEIPLMRSNADIAYISNSFHLKLESSLELKTTSTEDVLISNNAGKVTQENTNDEIHLNFIPERKTVIRVEQKKTVIRSPTELSKLNSIELPEESEANKKRSVAQWIALSPFKESSFDSSFVNTSTVIDSLNHPDVDLSNRNPSDHEKITSTKLQKQLVRETVSRKEDLSVYTVGRVATSPERKGPDVVNILPSSRFTYDKDETSYAAFKTNPKFGDINYTVGIISSKISDKNQINSKDSGMNSFSSISTGVCDRETRNYGETRPNSAVKSNLAPPSRDGSHRQTSDHKNSNVSIVATVTDDRHLCDNKETNSALRLSISSCSSDSSFENYLQKWKFKSNDKEAISSDKKYVPYKYQDDSFIDDFDDDESFCLPSLSERLRKKIHNKVPEILPSGSDFSPELPNLREKIHHSKRPREVTTGKTKGKTSDHLWRDSPRLIISSDSDGEVASPASRVTHHVTPSTKGPRSKTVQPKTEAKPKVPTTPRAVRCNSLGSSPVAGPLSLLASFAKDIPGARHHPTVAPLLRKFNKNKMALTQILYDHYNQHIFNMKLPSPMDIRWNVRMTKTAGYCYYQKDNSKETGRNSRIELSNKVLDAPDRLRDTLIHEMCHAASWIISGYKEGHGPLWKSWAQKSCQVFPELPPISRCHSYNITCKFTYRCTKCSYSLGRHSKSLDIERKVCGYCFGRFELVVNGASASKGTVPGLPPATPRTPNAFALFVKDNYKLVKMTENGSNGSLKHAEVMKTLSCNFARLKTNGIAD